MGAKLGRFWPMLGACILFCVGLWLTIDVSGTWRDNLRDLGPAIGGCWALAAGLLAYYATLDGISRQQESRAREIATVCHAEIEAAWQKLDEVKSIEKLKTSSRSIRESRQNIGDGDKHLNALVYRGSVGEAWLLLQSSNPEAFGVLGHSLARDVTAYYSALRNVIGRLNWMNSAQFEPSRYSEVVGRQEGTEEELQALREQKKELITKLTKRSLGP